MNPKVYSKDFIRQGRRERERKKGKEEEEIEEEEEEEEEKEEEEEEKSKSKLVSSAIPPSNLCSSMKMK
jgi:hypothetical protein